VVGIADIDIGATANKAEATLATRGRAETGLVAK